MRLTNRLATPQKMTEDHDIRMKRGPLNLQLVHESHMMGPHGKEALAPLGSTYKDCEPNGMKLKPWMT